MDAKPTTIALRAGIVVNRVEVWGIEPQSGYFPQAALRNRRTIHSHIASLSVLPDCPKRTWMVTTLNHLGRCNFPTLRAVPFDRGL